MYIEHETLDQNDATLATEAMNDDVYIMPTSFAQQRLWFLDQLEPNSAIYNIQESYRLRGPVDVAALERSLQAIVARHEVLRTSFALHDEQPVQVIAPHMPFTLQSVDLRDLSDDRKASIADLIHSAAQQPFDLRSGPLLRATLYQVDSSEWVLVLVVHHIIADGWSIGVLFAELTALYAAEVQQTRPTLAELPIQYADYAVWQHEWLQGPQLATTLAFWREQLAGAPALLELPTDHPRPPKQTFRGATHAFPLSPALSADVRALAQREGATVFMVLLATWQLLLARWSGQADVVVGTPIAGRTQTETEGLIGLFVNTLVLRTALDSADSFRALLRQVRTTTLSAYEHQALPFERLVEELQPQRSLSYNPLFQVAFTLQNAPWQPPQLSGAAVEPIELDDPTTKFDLQLSMRQSDDQLLGWIQYNTDLFEAATITRLAEHFQRLLAGAVAHPDQPVWSLPLLSSAEHDLLQRWSTYPVALPQPFLPDRLRGHATHTPDAIALVCGTATLTYAQLLAQANQLAHHLQALGVTPETRVALLLPRGLDALVAVVAVWQAGGAYVPLDPTTPAERLAFLLADSQPTVVLTTTALRPMLPPETAQVVDLTQQAPLIAQLPTTAPVVRREPEHLAYLIYTSGTTGQPKAVMVEQRHLAQLLATSQHALGLTAADTMPWIASIAFDITLLEVFGTLAVGGTTRIVTEAQILELPQLVAEVAQCTVLHTVPSLMQQLVDELEAQPAWLTRCQGLRLIATGGDAVPPALLERLTARFPQASVRVLYGPTETTVITCAYQVPPDTPMRGHMVGQPLPNASVRIVDRAGQLVPIGVAGELHLGGGQVTRGYWQRPALTAEKFVADAAQRWYRTGDLGRWLADGTIEFLGRIDHQVKVRGFRIELGEIETVLQQHPAVREAVVLARDATPGAKQLVAYVVGMAEADTDTLPATLRAWLKERLPAYMLPSAFVCLAALPLTPNGKLNRGALPAPNWSGQAYVAPRTDVEQTLATLWAEVLPVERVGIHDNFFELGGHSLLATQVVGRMNRAFESNVPLRHLFEAPTVAELAQIIEEARGSSGPEQQPSIQRIARSTPPPASFAQQRLWFLDQLEPNSATYNIQESYRLQGPLDLAALERSLQAIVQRHEVLRTSFVLHAEQPVQVIAPHMPFALAHVDLRSLPDDSRADELLSRLNQEAQRPFDLGEGPLLRATLYQAADTEWVLALVVHHIVADGWSMGVLFAELTARYQAELTNQPAPLPELPIQYADYAVWQHEWLQGEVLAQQLAFWREQLTGAPALLELPTDRPRPPAQTFRGATHAFQLPPALSADVRALAQREGATVFMVLLATWQLVLARWSSQDDVVVGTPIAGRTQTETEDLIGLFVNTLVLRARLDATHSFRALLRQVRATTLSAYEHQTLPFERLVEELQPQRSLSYSPLFQVLFILQNAPGAPPQLPGVTVQGMPAEDRSAKFDLSLSFFEGDSGLEGSLQYNVDLFDAATIARVAGHYQTLLTAAVANPDTLITALPLLTPDERQQLLVDWTATSAPYQVDQCLPDLVSAQAVRTPDAIALIDGARHLSYAELNARANQLAHHLQQLGIGPEQFVGVCLPRSADLIIALLAVLKAGGAYIPLDPAYPHERLQFMLDDAQASIILTTQQLRDRLPVGMPVLCLDTDADRFADQPDDTPAHGAAADNLAYVIYTSGSTGRPKGVAIAHRSAVALIDWASGEFTAKELSGVLAATSICFDLSVFEIFVPLSLGGTVIVAENALHLPTLPAANQVTLVNTVPSAIAELLRSKNIPDSVRTINLAGEPLPQALAQALYGLPSVERVLDLYGPSEDTTYSTWGQVRRGDSRPPTIGRPIANTRVYLLDRALQPLPVGAIGELYINGVGLARGYKGRPDLTAERFIPDPFNPSPGARMYRTGDLGRWLPNGEIDFLGRNDHQVKLRGFRIELGEIETALRQHATVREAVVLARDATPGQQQLVAYVVGAAGESPETLPATLRAFLAERLPTYMLPNAFVCLDALPLTPNGKLNRAALPAPDTRPAAAHVTVAPRDAVEQQLVQIWQTALSRSQVGIRDNFFDLGGHSLLAVRVFDQIEKQLGRKLPLATLFQAPTIEQLASLLRQETTQPSWSSLVPIQPQGSKPPFFCVHAVGGNVLSFQQLARHLGTDQPFYGLQAQGLDGKQPPHYKLEDMAAHYVKEIRTFQPKGPYYLGGMCFGGIVAYEMARQLHTVGEEVRALVLLDTWTPPALHRSFPGYHVRRLMLHLQHNLRYTPLRDILRELRERLNFRADDDPEEQQFQHVVAANHRATMDYIPQMYPGRITLLRPGEASRIPEYQARWSELTTAGLDCRVFKGNHWVMMDEPFVQDLAAVLAQVLDETQQL